VRQLPIETNPPEHTDYRRIVEPFFRRPRDPEFVDKVEALIRELLDNAAACERVEVVHDFSLPLQSRSLAYLLDVPESEADTWIGWGVHVFHDPTVSKEQGSVLDRYIEEHLDRGGEDPDHGIFSALHRATYRGRPLTREEMTGFVNLTFAGGRDTMIHSASLILHYFAMHPDALAWIRQDERRVVTATEEFLRYFSPLTHLGRVCPEGAEVSGHTVPADGRVSLCYASANRDAEAFEDPETVRLDRKPNPHVAFGFGPHTCLGALHARLVIRTLVAEVAARIGALEVLEAREHIEAPQSFGRVLGFDELWMRLARR